MTRTHWRNLSLLPWLILPAMLWRYWQLQDLLPERIAVHFNTNNVPNGWSDRGDFVVGFIGMTVGVLALFTILSLLPKRTSGVAGAMLFVQYAVSALMCVAFIGVLGIQRAEPGGRAEDARTRRGDDAGHRDRCSGDRRCKSRP